jgi:hypothetical protein
MALTLPLAHIRHRAPLAAPRINSKAFQERAVWFLDLERLPRHRPFTLMECWSSQTPSRSGRALNTLSVTIRGWLAKRRAAKLQRSQTYRCAGGWLAHPFCGVRSKGLMGASDSRLRVGADTRAGEKRVAAARGDESGDHEEAQAVEQSRREGAPRVTAEAIGQADGLQVTPAHA